jgi:hypothetical protein
MGRWKRWRLDRAIRSGAGFVPPRLRCPDCGVVSAGLKPKRVRLGTTLSPTGGGVLTGESGVGMYEDRGHLHRARSDSERLAAGGKYVFFYRCPACKSFFPASQAGLL